MKLKDSITEIRLPTAMNYSFDSRSYLRRARLRLDEGTSESLFYAAFELRCGIESRMQEYLDAQTHIAQEHKKGWQIAKLGKTIERAFKLGDRIIQIVLVDSETNKPLQTLYYTPVTSELQKMGKKLGGHLHVMKKRVDDGWWKRVRSFLESVYEELDRANKGTLVGPPLINPEGQIICCQECNGAPDDWLGWSFQLPKAGTKVIVEVNYLDSLPS